MNEVLILLCLHKSSFFHFCPSDSLPHPAAGERASGRVGLPFSRGQASTAAFCVFSLYHHKSAVLAQLNCSSSHPLGTLSAAFFPGTSVPAPTHQVVPSQGLNFPMSLWNITKLHWLISPAWLAHPEWQPFPPAYQLFPPICCHP